MTVSTFGPACEGSISSRRDNGFSIRQGLSRGRVQGQLIAAMLVAAFWVAPSGAAVQAEKPLKRSWRYKGVVGLNIAQTAFSNWAEGGTGAAAYTLTTQNEVSHEFGKYRLTWRSKFVFGQTKQEGEEVRKAADEVRIDIALARKIGIKVDPYVSVAFRSQFAKGFDYSQKPKLLRSDFLNPLYIVESAGVGLEPRPGMFWRLGLALKETGVTQTRFAAIYTDDDATTQVEKWRFETGVKSTFSGKIQLNSNLSYATRLALFTSFENLHTVDVNWENTVTAKVAKFVNVNLDVLVFYDEDISTRTQIKERLSIGLVYEFP